ncbi:hypothetical protein A3731_43140 [Roseovarius sp. HI0049]|nr:hypothetical protein A3731_43140 [Roseovarius sp. HI0049]
MDRWADAFGLAFQDLRGRLGRQVGFQRQRAGLRLAAFRRFAGQNGADAGALGLRAFLDGGLF